jgi:beta-glucosidase
MNSTRREALKVGAAVVALSAGLGAAQAAAGRRRFPKGFLWGAATAGHQVEGNNTNSDLWFLEHLPGSVFAEPSGDACNSFELWPKDLDLVKSLGLSSYRFSLEWSRIEPEPGRWSIAMFDHYLRMVEGCHARGLRPLVTFNHFTAPRWFAAAGGWMSAEAPARFAAFCDRAARHLGDGLHAAITINEPNLPALLGYIGLPPPLLAQQRRMLEDAAKRLGVERFMPLNVMHPDDYPSVLPSLLAGHRAAREAIKAAQPRLAVGVSLAIVDDQAVGDPARRDAKRALLYQPWLELARDDDFIGVQNYERSRIGPEGPLPPPAGARSGQTAPELWPGSLAGAVRYAHEVSGRPVLVTEHGVSTENDADRQWMIEEGLAGLHQVMQEGVPVLGYYHWSLLDNYEWIFGYRPKFGLATVDRRTFERRAKPSAAALTRIARSNAL